MLPSVELNLQSAAATIGLVEYPFSATGLQPTVLFSRQGDRIDCRLAVFPHLSLGALFINHFGDQPVAQASLSSPAETSLSANEFLTFTLGKEAYAIPIRNTSSDMALADLAAA